MSADAPAPLRRAKKYFDESAFKALHEAVGKLDFTPDFNPSIEAILAMHDVAFTEKMLALVKLQAWGNQSLFAVRDGSRNSPFTEADCARQFGVSRQIINRNAQKLIARYQLRTDGGRLYPVIDPEAEKRKVVNNGADTPSPNLRLLKERWFAEHPEIHEQYQKAFQFIDTINRQIAADLRAQVSTPVVTTAPEVAEQRGGHQNGSGADTPPTPLRTTETRILTEEKEERNIGKQAGYSGKNKRPARLPLARLREIEFIDDDALDSLDEHLAEELGAGYDRDAFIAFALARAGKRRIGAGLILDREGLPRDFIQKVKGEPRAPVPDKKPEPAIEEQIATLEGLLSLSETHPQNAEWREELNDLRLRKAGSAKGAHA